MTEDVCVLIPTLDEAETIGDVIDGFRAEGYENVLVIDGGSADETREIARDHGARVVEQRGEGKGQAVIEALEEIDAEYVLLVDGDATYRPEDADAMLEPLREGRAEHVIGNRFADMHPGAMTRLNRLGNRLINRTFAVVHHHNLTDVLSGYRAFSVDAIERLDLSSNGFGIETELAVECVRQGVDTEVVPIGYRPRPDGSETNLHPLRDGAVIALTLYRLAKLNNPILYYGAIGSTSMLAGGVLGLYVGYRWFVEGISHEVLALLGSFAILLGIQIIMFGVLSDMIVTLHREQRRRIEQITDDE
jgi:dolichol-phosphate mannosyltransferase